MDRLRRVGAIASNTVREAIRHRILYTLLFFAVLIIATGVLLAALSYVERERILQDVGLAAIRIFGAATAIFVGVNLIHREVERRTVYTVLAKPLSRMEFLLGKYLGLVATIWLQVAAMGLAFVAVSLATGASLGAGHAAAIALIGAEDALLVAVATFFSAFTTPLLASLFSAGIYVLGRLSRELRNLGAQTDDPLVETGTAVLYQVLPDLRSFDLSIVAVHDLPIGLATAVALPVLYAAFYSLFVLLAAWLVFERRDLR